MGLPDSYRDLVFLGPLLGSSHDGSVIPSGIAGGVTTYITRDRQYWKLKGGGEWSTLHTWSRSVLVVLVLILQQLSRGGLVILALIWRMNVRIQPVGPSTVLRDRINLHHKLHCVRKPCSKFHGMF